MQQTTGIMKKKYLLPIISIVLVSCKKSSDFTLQATFDDLEENSHVLVVYDDPNSRLDTIYPQDGKFVYRITPDTTTLFRLLSPKGDIIPIIAEPARETVIKGSFQHPVIEGEGENGEYGKFLSSLSGLKGNLPAIQKEAEKFILSHIHSFASAYVLNQYFVQVPEPDPEKIEELMKPLSGNIKDSRVMGVVLKALDQHDSKNKNPQQVSFFSCRDRNGKYISWNNDNEGYTLLNFWASWDRTSKEKKDSLYNILRKFPQKKFKAINVSLDYDKSEWLHSCKDDSEQWIETCDLKGWNNQLVKQNAIDKLPANILIDRNRKIIAKNLYNEALYNKVNELTKEK